MHQYNVYMNYLRSFKKYKHEQRDPDLILFECQTRPRLTLEFITSQALSESKLKLQFMDKLTPESPTELLFLIKIKKGLS